MHQILVVEEEEEDQLQGSQEGEAEEVEEVDHHQGEEVEVVQGEVVVLPCYLAKGEGEVVQVEVLRGLVGGEELVEEQRSQAGEGQGVEEVVEEVQEVQRKLQLSCLIQQSPS